MVTQENPSDLGRRQKHGQNQGLDLAVVCLQRSSGSLGQGAGLAAPAVVRVVACVFLADTTDKV